MDRPCLYSRVVTCLLFVLSTAVLDVVVEAGFCDDDKAAGWELVWHDEFEGSVLDATKWSAVTGYDSGLGRAAFLTTDNVYVSAGNLILRSQRNSTYNYTSGAVVSQGKGAWKHGRACVSAKLPGVTPETSEGLWPAHWMMPNDKSCWPDHGEIDIMEMWNSDGRAQGTYHWSSAYPNTTCQHKNQYIYGDTHIKNWHTTYHEFATEWGADYVAFFIDGVSYVNITGAQRSPQGFAPYFPPDAMYLLLNTAVGGSYQPNDKTLFPAYHTIDYVRVAQRIGTAK
jgi:beta-glucanase (GH16 family)